MRSSYSFGDERCMFGEEPAYKNRPHDIGQAPKRNGEANKVIDLNLQKQFVGSPGGNRILYNQHIGSFSPEPFWLVCATKVYSGLGADIVMESITTLGIRDFTKRRLSNFLQKLSRWCVTQLTHVS